jgi:hypothetical protein
MKRAPRSGEVGREMSPGASGDADRSPAGQQAPGHRATDQTGATKDQAARHGARAGSGCVEPREMVLSRTSAPGKR